MPPTRPDTGPDRAAATLGDHEAFVTSRADDTRWELIGGVIVATTDPTEAHEQIVANLFAPSKLAMDKAGCRTYAGGMRVQRSDAGDEAMATLPDILVRCVPRRDRTFNTDPLVVFEVLSRSKMHRDRGPKFDFHRSLPGLRHTVLVYQGQMRVEQARRSAEGWILEVLSSPSGVLALDAVGFAIDLDTIHFDVPVLRPLETPGAGTPKPPTLLV